MTQQIIDIGTVADDGTGTPGRDAFDMVNDNFTELYTTRALVVYTAVTTATRLITDAELVLGMNIFGVNRAGVVTITLPASTDTNKIIVINDESGAAGANNITIQVA
jgi:hypothetical protein